MYKCVPLFRNASGCDLTTPECIAEMKWRNVSKTNKIREHPAKQETIENIFSQINSERFRPAGETNPEVLSCKNPAVENADAVEQMQIITRLIAIEDKVIHVWVCNMKCCNAQEKCVRKSDSRKLIKII
jgi:hypothetical protein